MAAITLSPAPVTSNTSRAAAATCSGAPPALEEAHAVLAAGDEHRAAAQQREDAASGRGELRGPREPHPGHLLGLELVGGHDVAPAVEAEVAQLRVHQHRHAAAPRERQHAPQQPRP